jgi:predicted nucleic acid-binding protein
MFRIALDTNVLTYLAGIDRSPQDRGKIDATRNLVAKLNVQAALIAPVQALGELFVVLSRAGVSADEVRTVLIEYSQSLETADSSAPIMAAALDLVVDHRLQYWDALILSASAEAGATLLLSEDMQDGFVWRGLTVVNPYAPIMHRKLAAAI